MNIGRRPEALKIVGSGLAYSPDAKVLLEQFRLLGGKASNIPKPAEKARKRLLTPRQIPRHLCRPILSRQNPNMVRNRRRLHNKTNSSYVFGTHSLTAIRRSLAYSIADSYLALPLQLVGTMIISRLLTPAETGVFAVAAVFAAFASTFRDFGITEYLIQENELDAEKIRAAFTVNIAISWAMALLLFFSAPLAADFYRSPRQLQKSCASWHSIYS